MCTRKIFHKKNQKHKQLLRKKIDKFDFKELLIRRKTFMYVLGAAGIEFTQAHTHMPKRTGTKVSGGMDSSNLQIVMIKTNKLAKRRRKDLNKHFIENETQMTSTLEKMLFFISNNKM